MRQEELSEQQLTHRRTPIYRTLKALNFEHNFFSQENNTLLCVLLSETENFSTVKIYNADDYSINQQKLETVFTILSFSQFLKSEIQVSAL